MIRTVYVAGPYSGDTLLNVAAAIEVAEQVARMGLFPFVPHLFHYWGDVYAHDYEFWMEQDAEWLRRCDALLMFATSPGAERELVMAKSRSIPVFLTIQELAKVVASQGKIETFR